MYPKTEELMLDMMNNNNFSCGIVRGTLFDSIKITIPNHNPAYFNTRAHKIVIKSNFICYDKNGHVRFLCSNDNFDEVYINSYLFFKKRFVLLNPNLIYKIRKELKDFIENYNIMVDQHNNSEDDKFVDKFKKSWNIL